jgi:hypothetical protein
MLKISIFFNWLPRGRPYKRAFFNGFFLKKVIATGCPRKAGHFLKNLDSLGCPVGSYYQHPDFLGPQKKGLFGTLDFVCVYLC